MKNLSFNNLCLFAVAALGLPSAALASGGPPVAVPDASSTLGLAVLAVGGLIAARRLVNR